MIFQHASRKSRSVIVYFQGATSITFWQSQESFYQQLVSKNFAVGISVLEVAEVNDDLSIALASFHIEIVFLTDFNSTANLHSIKNLHMRSRCNPKHVRCFCCSPFFYILIREQMWLTSQLQTKKHARNENVADQKETSFVCRHKREWKNRKILMQLDC